MRVVRDALAFGAAVPGRAACGAQGGWGAYLDGERVSCRAASATTTAIRVGVALEFHSAYLDVRAPMAPNARRVDPRYVVEVQGVLD
ncbi:hypothetical protein ACIRN4_21965 [Pimelobacter simplex]|uniref:hypothetical protein n=1 Tax=Nocardioides simplex TaxID=2045 RepID=UPI0038213DDC